MYVSVGASFPELDICYAVLHLIIFNFLSYLCSEALVVYMKEGSYRGQNWVWDPLELELQVVVSFQVWMLELNLRLL